MPKVMLGIKLYSTAEVAELLGVCEVSVRKYTQEKRIKATTIGGKRYYSEENIKKFLLKTD